MPGQILYLHYAFIPLACIEQEQQHQQQCSCSRSAAAASEVKRSAGASGFWFVSAAPPNCAGCANCTLACSGLVAEFLWGHSEAGT